MLVVALANTSAGLDFVSTTIVFSGVFIIFALWWLYFGHLEECGTGKRPKNLFLYLHSHAFLFGSVILLAAAYKNMLEHGAYMLADTLLLTAGVSLAAVTLAIIRMTLSGLSVRLMQVGALFVAGTLGVLWVGYTLQDSTLAATLFAVWVVLWAALDEFSRHCYTKHL